MNTKFLTTKQLAERWHMNVETLSNWRVKGIGPAYTKLGAGKNTKVLYREDDIIAFETEHIKEH